MKVLARCGHRGIMIKRWKAYPFKPCQRAFWDNELHICERCQRRDYLFDTTIKNYLYEKL
jgi:hypothetical protein